MIFFTIQFLNGILGFIFNRKNITLLVNSIEIMLLAVTLLVLISSLIMFILSIFLDKTFLDEFHEIDSTTLMALSPYFVTGFTDAEGCNPKIGRA